MNYADPRLRAILSGEYVLGTLPSRARARFERLMRYDAGLAGLVGDWADRLGAIDTSAAATPPARRVWSAIDARTRPRQTARAIRSRVWPPVGWAAAGAVAAVAIVFLFARPQSAPQPVAAAAPPPPQVVAVLSDNYGKPGWIVTFDRPRASFDIAALRPNDVDEKHSYELWVIEDDKPLKLGVIATAPQQVVAIPAADVPRSGVVFAVSLEPAGGSPGDGPTGPVVYRGPIIQD